MMLAASLRPRPSGLLALSASLSPLGPPRRSVPLLPLAASPRRPCLLIVSGLSYLAGQVDYIKVDTCRTGAGKPFDGSQFNTTHPLVSKWFLQYAAAAKRPVLYHPSGISLRDNAGDPRGGPGPHPHQFKLYAKIANMWRAYKDMQPAWSEVDDIINYWAADNESAHPRLYAREWEDWLSVSRPGVFQDPDALLVGNANTSTSCRECLNNTEGQTCVDRERPDVPCICCGSLSLVEEQTNMVMWAMWAAPLEIAADLRSIAPSSAAILRNPEVRRAPTRPLARAVPSLHKTRTEP